MIGRIDQGGPGPEGTNRCAMTWRYLLCSCSACAGLRARGKVTDLPPCAPLSMAVVQVINDRLSHDARQRLAARIPLIPSVTDADPDTLDHVERRAALWAARSVEHMSAQAWAVETAVAPAWWGDPATWVVLAVMWVAEAAAADSDDALLDWLDDFLAAWHKIAADEGLMGSCDWLDPADFVQAGGS